MNHRSNALIVNNDITSAELLNDDDDDNEFYDAETDKRSISNDRSSNDGKVISKVGGLERKRYGRPRGASNLSDHSSHNRYSLFYFLKISLSSSLSSSLVQALTRKLSLPEGRQLAHNS